MSSIFRGIKRLEKEISDQEQRINDLIAQGKGIADMARAANQAGFYDVYLKAKKTLDEVVKPEVIKNRRRLKDMTAMVDQLRKNEELRLKLKQEPTKKSGFFARLFGG